MKDFYVKLSGSFDNIAMLGGILGAACVNIEGLCLFTDEGRTLVHFAVMDEAPARNALEKSGIEILAVSDVAVLQKDERRVTGKSGSFGEICRMFARNGIQIIFGYPAENNRFIFGVSDTEAACKLLRQQPEA
ncbi:MAG: hypothetical protein MUE56_06245 [Ignavibacteria bacterium]|jgi:hypothetical protein|nr:hypothetical protein [Ignavibacteria bacterium]